MVAMAAAEWWGVGGMRQHVGSASPVNEPAWPPAPPHCQPPPNLEERKTPTPSKPAPNQPGTKPARRLTASKGVAEHPLAGGQLVQEGPHQQQRPGLRGKDAQRAAGQWGRGWLGKRQGACPGREVTRPQRSGGGLVWRGHAARHEGMQVRCGRLPLADRANLIPTNHPLFIPAPVRCWTAARARSACASAASCAQRSAAGRC